MTLTLAMSRKKKSISSAVRVRHCRRKSSSSRTSVCISFPFVGQSVRPPSACPHEREFACCGLALVQQSSLDPDRAGQPVPRRDEFMRVRAVARSGGCGREIGQ